MHSENLKKIINIKNLSVGYNLGKKTVEILKNISLSADENQLIALVGKNGVGKSTFLRSVAGLQDFFSGEIFISNQNLSDLTLKERAKMLSFVPSTNENLPSMKAEEIVAMGRFPHTGWLGKLSEKDKKIVEKAIENTKMHELAQKQVTQLSDGEKKRIFIAKALSQNTPIIILDEPTAFLDIPSKHLITNILNQLTKQENKLIIFSTHDLDIAIKYADKIWIINQKGKIVSGSPEDLILNDELSFIFDDENVNFDKINGSFFFNKKTEKSVQIINQTKSLAHKKWTEKAFERIGYQISENSDFKIYIKSNNNEFVWQINQTNFKDIENLIKNL